MPNEDLLTQSTSDFMSRIRPRPQGAMFVGQEVFDQLSPEIAAQVRPGMTVGRMPSQPTFDALQSAAQSILSAREQKARKAAEAGQEQMRELQTRAATLDATTKMIRALGLPAAVENQMLKDSLKTMMPRPSDPGGLEFLELPGGGRAMKITQPGGKFSVRPMPSAFGPVGEVSRSGFPGIEQTDLATGRTFRQNIPKTGASPDAVRADRDYRQNRTLWIAQIKQLDKDIAANAANLPGEGDLERLEKDPKRAATLAMYKRAVSLDAQLRESRVILEKKLTTPQPVEAPGLENSAEEEDGLPDDAFDLLPRPQPTPTPTPTAPKIVMRWKIDSNTGQLVPTR